MMKGAAYRFPPVPVDFFGAETTSLDGVFFVLIGVVMTAFERVLQADLDDLQGAGMMQKDAERKFEIGKAEDK